MTGNICTHAWIIRWCGFSDIDNSVLVESESILLEKGGYVGEVDGKVR